MWLRDSRIWHWYTTHKKGEGLAAWYLPYRIDPHCRLSPRHSAVVTQDIGGEIFIFGCDGAMAFAIWNEKKTGALIVFDCMGWRCIAMDFVIRCT
jgi:hypothetical protein